MLTNALYDLHLSLSGNDALSHKPSIYIIVAFGLVVKDKDLRTEAFSCQQLTVSYRLLLRGKIGWVSYSGYRI